jgi:hypothetical protein
VAKPRAWTLGGSNKMLSAREIAAILPERMVTRNGGTGDCPSTQHHVFKRFQLDLAA